MRDSIGVAPTLRAEQLRGVVLFCGFYDMRALIDRGRMAQNAIVRWGIRTMVWAYSGSRSTDSPDIRGMSTIDHVTAKFPSTFLSGGNGDPLTAAQSAPMAEKLRELGVPVVTLFYDVNHQPRASSRISIQSGPSRRTEGIRRDAEILGTGHDGTRRPEDDVGTTADSGGHNGDRSNGEAESVRIIHRTLHTNGIHTHVAELVGSLALRLTPDLRVSVILHLCGHWIPHEQPVKTNDLLLEFLGGPLIGTVD